MVRSFSWEPGFPPLPQLLFFGVIKASAADMVGDCSAATTSPCPSDPPAPRNRPDRSIAPPAPTEGATSDLPSPRCVALAMTDPRKRPSLPAPCCCGARCATPAAESRISSSGTVDSWWWWGDGAHADVGWAASDLLPPRGTKEQPDDPQESAGGGVDGMWWFRDNLSRRAAGGQDWNGGGTNKYRREECQTLSRSCSVGQSGHRK